MKHACSKCGHEDEINPAAMLGAIRTPKKEAAWKANGERLKKMYANARKVGERPPAPGPSLYVEKRLSAELPQVDTRVMPKGGLTREDLKAMIAGHPAKDPEKYCPHGVSWARNCPKCEGVPELQNTPTAPFDFKDENGDPHRVKAYGKFLKVCFLRDGVEEPLRNLHEGELERLWERRIIK